MVTYEDVSVGGNLEVIGNANIEDSVGVVTARSGLVVSSGGANITGGITGDLTGDVTGNADTATTLATSRTLSISSAGTGSASFDGSGNADIALTLADSGASAGTYGSATNLLLLQFLKSQLMLKDLLHQYQQTL